MPISSIQQKQFPNVALCTDPYDKTFPGNKRLEKNVKEAEEKANCVGSNNYSYIENTFFLNDVSRKIVVSKVVK